MTPEEIKNMKVADLRAELTKREADSKGNKNELAARLIALIEKDPPANGTAPALEVAPEPKAAEAAAEPSVPSTEDPITSKRQQIVFAAAADHPKKTVDLAKPHESVVELVKAEEARKQQRLDRFKDSNEDAKIKARAARFGVVSEDERKKQRARRFGMEVAEDEEEKKKQRAQRFGNPPTEVILKFRAEKFKPLSGEPTASEDATGKKRVPISSADKLQADTDFDAKKKARMERFKAT